MLRTGALLAELHAHTTWSDGSLPLPALVDLYGSRGFDVLCVPDHACRTARVPRRLEERHPCGRDEEAVVRHLRSRRPVLITQVGVEAERAAA